MDLYWLRDSSNNSRKREKERETQEIGEGIEWEKEKGSDW